MIGVSAPTKNKTRGDNRNMFLNRHAVTVANCTNVRKWAQAVVVFAGTEALIER